MSVPNNKRMGEHGSGDNYPKDIFAHMGQGEMKRKPLKRGLFVQMAQTPMKPASGKLMPGKCAPSVARAMGQPGR